ncbi:carbon storage regulator [Priestia endophytica]
MPLVLGRQLGEGIIIEDSLGNKIEVGLIKTDGVLRLTVDAPKDFKIFRSEIYGQKDRPAK